MILNYNSISKKYLNQYIKLKICLMNKKIDNFIELNYKHMFLFHSNIKKNILISI